MQDLPPTPEEEKRGQDIPQSSTQNPYVQLRYGQSSPWGGIEPPPRPPAPRPYDISTSTSHSSDFTVDTTFNPSYSFLMGGAGSPQRGTIGLLPQEAMWINPSFAVPSGSVMRVGAYPQMTSTPTVGNPDWTTPYDEVNGTQPSTYNQPGSSLHPPFLGLFTDFLFP